MEIVKLYDEDGNWDLCKVEGDRIIRVLESSPRQRESDGPDRTDPGYWKDNF